MTQAERFTEYFNIIATPDKMQKVAKLDFLNPDGSVAFTVDNNHTSSATGAVYSKAFLQTGTLTVSLNNGQRRKASVSFANLDGDFDYAVNKLWFGQQIRLAMGVKLSDGSNFFIPQGVFCIDSPTLEWKPNSRKASYDLVDKWANLDGSLFGNLRYTYLVESGENIFAAMRNVLKLDKYTLSGVTDNKLKMLDYVTPLLPDVYFHSQDTDGDWLDVVPTEIRVEQGGSCADVLLSLNDLYAGYIGYDSTGALVSTPSETNVEDIKKPVMWDYTTSSKTFLGLNETAQTSEVYNEVVMIGEALTDTAVTPYAIAQNNDPNSDTSVDKIGCKTYVENSSGYYTTAQCEALAKYKLKRKSVLQKQVTFTSTQMFHLQENSLVTVKRSDKDGAPIERHLIQSFSIPIAQTGTMSITATSVVDYPSIQITESGGGS